MDQSVSMQNLFNSNGKVNLFGWIVFIGTLLLIGYSVYNSYVNIKKIQKDELLQLKKMKEYEMNLRKMMGSQYVEL